MGIATLVLTSSVMKAQGQATFTVEELNKRLQALENENAKKKEWDVSLYGWVRTEYYFDSRQSAYSREYHLNLYPLDKNLDANGEDFFAFFRYSNEKVVAKLYSITGGNLAHLAMFGGFAG